MGDVIDFKSTMERINHDLEDPQAPHAGEEVELTYDPKPGSVGVSVYTIPDGTAHLTVTAPAADVATVMATARNALLASFGIAPGDERGLEAVMSSVGQASFDAFVASFVQQHFFGKAMLRTGIMPFLSPDFLTDDVPQEGEDYVYELEVLMRPSYELTSYDPVKVKLPEKREVGSKDVTACLDGMAEELATWENDPSRESVSDGDHVSLNLDATADGREFKPLTGRHLPYVVGSGAISPEFDGNLVGMKPRERRDISVSVALPDDQGGVAYQVVQLKVQIDEIQRRVPAKIDDVWVATNMPEAQTLLGLRSRQGGVAYQVVQLKVQIDEIQRRVPAKIDDVWVATNMPEAQTLLGLRSRVRTLLEREAEAAYHDELMVLCAEELATRLVGDPDERYVEKMRDELISQYIEDLHRSGIDYQQFVSQPGFDVNLWEKSMLEEADHALRRGLALDSLADHLDIQLEEADIAKVVSAMAPGHEEEVLGTMVETGQMPKMCEIALRTRANEWLVDHVQSVGLKGSGALVLEGGAIEGGRPRQAKGEGPKLQLL